MTVKRIVVCMLENRSFDHLLGWMSLKPYGDRADVDGLTGPIDEAKRELVKLDYENPALGNLYHPFIVKEDLKLQTDLPHGRELVNQQLSPDPHGPGYRMDGFAAAHIKQFQSRVEHPEPLAIFPPALIPATSFLARAYMVCDRWFCPIPTDTHPNRLMALAGYTKIDTTAGKPPSHDPVLMDWCKARNIRWRVYSNGFPFLAVVRPEVFLFGSDHFRNFDDLARDFQAEPDARFPQVIFVEPDYLDDPLAKHPNDNHPPLPMGPGEAFLADVYRAVTSNKDRWKDTVLLVLYDEHGGFYDHVPPFAVTTKPPKGHKWQDATPFKTSGPRVPAFVVSPLVGPATASRKRFDHTAILQFIADTFDGGNPYSPEVAARHKEGGIDRIKDVLGTTLRKDAPVLPPLHAFSSVTFTGERAATTPGMQAFANARAQVTQLDAHKHAERTPEIAFNMPVPKLPTGAKK